MPHPQKCIYAPRQIKGYTVIHQKQSTGSCLVSGQMEILQAKILFQSTRKGAESFFSACRRPNKKNSMTSGGNHNAVHSRRLKSVSPMEQ